MVAAQLSPAQPAAPSSATPQAAAALAELEPLDAAISELNGLIVRHELALAPLYARREALLSDRNDVRRRRAWQTLDEVYPPLQFFSIERGSRALFMATRWRATIVRVYAAHFRSGPSAEGE